MKHSNGRIFIGLLLILLGGIFFVKNIELFPWQIEYYYLSWPSYLILAGLIITIVSRGKFLGPALLLTGGIFLLGRVYDYPASELFGDLWPVFIILFGLSLIFQHRSKGACREKSGWETYEGDTMDISTVFGETKKKIVSQSFMGAKISTLFGATELDLSTAKLARSCSINTDTIFGGTEIIVPSEWKVVNKTTAIFGGWEDQRRKSAPVENSMEHVLTIDGFVMFGGIDIKS